MKTKAVGLALAALLTAGTMFAKGGAQLDTVENHVRHELVSLPYFSVFDNLSFRVDAGTVTLFGQVTQPWLKDDAQRAVQRLEGVHHVDNQIEVLPLSTFDDQIRIRTYRTLVRTAGLDRYFMGVNPSIRIIVKNGHVTLVGFVSNDMDRTLASMRARMIPGAFEVDNQLQIQK